MCGSDTQHCAPFRCAHAHALASGKPAVRLSVRIAVRLILGGLKKLQVTETLPDWGVGSGRSQHSLLQIFYRSVIYDIDHDESKARAGKSHFGPCLALALIHCRCSRPYNNF
eukprot:364792-Chlamydomonas_euryale.AAC.25